MVMKFKQQEPARSKNLLTRFEEQDMHMYMQTLDKRKVFPGHLLMQKLKDLAHYGEEADCKLE